MDKKVLLVTPDSCKLPSFGYRLKKAFHNNGWKTDNFNIRYMYMHKTGITKKVLSKIFLKKALHENPDLVFVDKGQSIEEHVIQKISDAGIKTANWCLDDPFGEFSQLNNIRNRSEYDHFFVFDPYYVPKLKESGQHNAHYLPCAVDTDLYKEEIPLSRQEYSSDISFIGSHEKKREEILGNLNKTNLKIWGYRWKEINRNSLIYSKVQDKLMRFDRNSDDLKEYCKTLNSSKINLNIHSLHSRESVNLRTFEIPATKSFELCDNFKEMQNLFRIDKEIACYNDINELKEKTEYYLRNEDERNRISEAGYRRVVSEHTFMHRIKKVLETI
ncbi:MAG: glycosyltransferase [archaeon]